MEDHLLAPVAQQVAAEVGRGFGAVAGGASESDQAGGAVSCPLVDLVAVEQFVLQVAVPVDTEIDAGLGSGELLALAGVDARARGRPHLGAGGARVDVAGHAATVVRVVVGAPQDLAGLRVVQLVSVRDAGVLVDLPHFQPRVVGIEIAHVHRVAVPEAGAVHELAVVVDGARAFDDLVEAVAVDVSGGQIVVALAEALDVRRSGVVVPALLEGGAVPAPGGERHAAVVASLHDRVGLDAVEPGGGGQEAIHAIGRFGGLAPAVGGIAPGIVGDGGQFLAVGAPEDGEVFGTGGDESRTVAEVGRVVVGGGRSLREERSRAVLGARCRLADEFGLAVAVEVGHHHLGVVGARADVLAQVDAPQLLAREGVPVEDHVAGVAALRVVLAVGGVPLHHEIPASVAVEVAHGDVGGGVGERFVGGGRAARRAIERDLQRLAGPGGGGAADRLLYPVQHGADGVGGTRGARGVHEVGGTGDHVGVHLGGAAIDVESEAGGIGSQDAPAQEDSVGDLHGHQTAVEILHLAREGVGAGKGCDEDRRGEPGEEWIRTHGILGVQVA